MGLLVVLGSKPLVGLGLRPDLWLRGALIAVMIDGSARGVCGCRRLHVYSTDPRRPQGHLFDHGLTGFGRGAPAPLAPSVVRIKKIFGPQGGGRSAPGPLANRTMLGRRRCSSLGTYTVPYHTIPYHTMPARRALGSRLAAPEVASFVPGNFRSSRRSASTALKR